MFAGVEGFRQGDEMKEAFDLEAIYDNEIAPLMAEIIGICREHKLPMYATFLYANDPQEDRADFCSTQLLFEERPIPEQMFRLDPMMRQTSSFTPLRMRVTKSDGSVEDTVIL